MEKLTLQVLNQLAELIKNQPVTLTSIEMSREYLNQLGYVGEVVNKPSDDNYNLERLTGVPMYISDDILGYKLYFSDGSFKEHIPEKFVYKYIPTIDNSIALNREDTTKVYEQNKKVFDEFKSVYGWLK